MSEKTIQSYLLDTSAPEAQVSYSQEYSELKRMVREAGLLDRRIGYYVLKVIEVSVLLAIGVAVLLITDLWWVQILNALYMGFVFSQFGFMMHDGGHRAVFRKPEPNQAFGMVYANLMLGISISEWQRHHNEHHAHPNVLEVDPSFEPLLAWSSDQAVGRSGLPALVARYQKWALLPLMSLLPFGFRIDAFKHLFIKGHARQAPLEAVFYVLHFVWYFGLVFGALPWWLAILFALINNLAAGLLLGMAFAPNHKGMPVVEKGKDLDFLYFQTVTTRNVRPGPLTDYLYGGLNYQVEHHLFPGLARINMKKVYGICKDFCIEKGIPYYETGFFQSWQEIFDYMEAMGRPLRFQDFKG